MSQPSSATLADPKRAGSTPEGSAGDTATAAGSIFVVRPSSASPLSFGSAPWAPAPASAAGCSSAALPRFPVLCAAPPTAATATQAAAGVTGGVFLFEQLPWQLLAGDIGGYLDVQDWLRLFSLSSTVRRRLLSGLAGQQLPQHEVVPLGVALKEMRVPLAPDPPMQLWTSLSSNESLSSSLSPSKFAHMDADLRLEDSTATRPPDCGAGTQISMRRVVLGGWFNKLRAQDEVLLWLFLSHCRLEQVEVTPEYYSCDCACCVKVRTEQSEGTAPGAVSAAYRPVRVTVPAEGHHRGSPGHVEAAATPRLPGSPGRTPYRRTHSGRWQRRRIPISPEAGRHGSTFGTRARLEEDSPGTSLQAFSSQRFYSLPRRIESFEANPQAPRRSQSLARAEYSHVADDEPGDADGTAGAYHVWQREGDSRRESPLSRRAESAPRNIGLVVSSSSSSSNGSLSPRDVTRRSIEPHRSSAAVESGNYSEQTTDADACISTARKHAVSRIFWLFRLLLAHRTTVKYFNFNSPPPCCRTCGIAAEILPEFPAPLRSLHGSIRFTQLEELKFGPAVDCRYIVPFVDFCAFDKLRLLEVLGLPLSYTESEPQFGKEPTLVFGPQFIFAAGDSAPLWLPAVYNGRIDGQLQLQGRGVYASREYRYEGSFHDGRNEGIGMMASTCGETYCGEWHDGRRHGSGVVTQADGRRLQGTWDKDSLHGRGDMYVNGGLNYDGEWKHGVLDGWGVMSNREGELLAFGQFRSGRTHGWVVHRCDEAAPGKWEEKKDSQVPSIVSNEENNEEESVVDSDEWDVASFDDLDSALGFPLELTSIMPGERCNAPSEFRELMLKRQRERLVYRIHKLPGWRGVWKRHVSEEDAAAADHTQQILLLSSNVCKQKPPTALVAAEIEDPGEPPEDIPLWIDGVLGKLEIHGLSTQK